MTDDPPPGDTPALEFFFDYGSPFSYLADSRLAALAERTGARIVYRPMLLGGVFKATGNRSPVADPVEARRRHVGTDMARWVRHLGVPFAPNPHFPVDTLRVMRHAHAALRAGAFEAFHAAMFPAMWVRGLDLGDPEVIADVERHVGLDAPKLALASEDPDVKAALRATTEEAVARGAFGAPTFFVAGEMFFGNDRFHFVEQALIRGAGA